MEKASVLEKRTSKRVDFHEPAQFQFKDPRYFGGCLSKDLSEGGIRVYFNEFVALDTVVNLTISLGLEHVDCPARVVWIEKDRFNERYQAGLEFIKAEETLGPKHRIRDFIE